jgi:hypothetical protein
VRARQIGVVLGPGLALYFKALRMLAIVFGALACTCVAFARARENTRTHPQARPAAKRSCPWPSPSDPGGRWRCRALHSANSAGAPSRPAPHALPLLRTALP